MRKPLVVGNWKMHGNAAGIRSLMTELIQEEAAFAGAEVGVCPPFVFLPLVTELCAGSSIRIGAQNLSQHDRGAFTGEVSAAMLAELGADYVLVGHSERRELFGESSETVAEKFLAAQAQGLTPILCLGETLEQREGGETEKTVLAQLDAILAASGIEAFANSVLAYEPVWAIGTGK
ncbi:MAG: triose-phosphate isomerase, partial [Pseudomonadota bacterium]|nr:triose-phosphate isomerase [Pseudomonadota bacterium]